MEEIQTLLNDATTKYREGLITKMEALREVQVEITEAIKSHTAKLNAQIDALLNERDN